MQPQDEEVAADDAVIAPELDEQIDALRQKVKAEPEQEEHQAALADLLVKVGEVDEAKVLLGKLKALAEGDAAKRVRSRIHLVELLDEAPSAVELQEAIAKDPKNLKARNYLAARFFLAGQAAAAMDQWLTILKTDRSYEQDLGRRSLLDAFRMLDDADLVGDYRRKLSTALF